MAKVNDRTIYPNIDFPSLLDFLLGTKEVNGKTRSFPIQSVVQLINGVNGKNNIQFEFSDGTDPEIDYLSEGNFFTNTNETSVGNFSQLIFNKNTIFPIDISQLFNRLGELENVVLRLEHPENPNNFFNFKVNSFQDNDDYFIFGVQDFNGLYLGELVNDAVYSLYFNISSDISEDFSKVVYFNSTNPDTATIFDLNNPPLVNDNSLKSDDDNLYIANDATTWVYKTSTSAYETKSVTSSLSNFYLTGTTIDAGSTKSAPIERTGTVGGGAATLPNHFVIKSQLDLKEDLLNKTSVVTGNETSTSLYLSILGAVSYFQRKLTDSIFGTFINSLLNKVTPVDADTLTLSDSADGDKAKKISFLNVFNYIKSKSDTEISYACSDEISDLMVGTLITFRMPYTMTLSLIKLSLNTAPTVNKVVVDIKKNGVSIFSTLSSVDTGQTTSVGASIPAVISDPNLTNDTIITIATTQVGGGAAGKGLKVTFIGKRS